jgi:hypothetical protein
MMAGKLGVLQNLQFMQKDFSERSGLILAGKGMSGKTIKRILVPAIAAVLITACVTTKLWEATDPHKFVEISMVDISEKELQNRQVKYYTDLRKRCYYVEKDGLQKFQDYTLRVLITPVTVVLDTATAIVVVGLLFHGRGHGYGPGIHQK